MPPPPTAGPLLNGSGYTALTTSTTANFPLSWAVTATTGQSITCATISDLQYEITFPIELSAGATFSWSWSLQSLPARAETHADAARRRAEAADFAERERAAVARRREERRALHARAEELLLRWLTDAQRSSYREHGRFDVRGSDGRRWRIICRGQSGNVQVLSENGEWMLRLCAHPPDGLPDPDAWLGQALAIATNAPEFEAIANIHERRVLAAPLAA